MNKKKSYVDFGKQPSNKNMLVQTRGNQVKGTKRKVPMGRNSK